MRNKKLIISILFFTLSDIVINIIGFFIINLSLIIIITNIIILAILTVLIILLIYFSNKENKTARVVCEGDKNTLNDDIEKRDNLINISIKLIFKSTEILKNIFGNFPVNYNFDLNKNPGKNIENLELENKINIINNIDKIFNDLNTEYLIHIIDIFHIISNIHYKIPYFKILLNHTIQKTENAAMVMIEKYDVLSSEFYNLKRISVENFNKMRSGVKNQDYSELITTSKTALKKYNNIIDELFESNKKNGNKLQEISNWINKVHKLLGNINEISERNKIISINSSIEAARMGEKGAGFRILANEIRSLNNKTDSLIKEINTIMTGFKKFNQIMNKDWNTNTENYIKNIEEIHKSSEEVLNIVIDSYKMAQEASEASKISVEKVNESVNEIIHSLQFQDITRQQIESVMKLLDTINNEIKSRSNVINQFGFIINEKNNIINKEVKNEILNNLRHFDKNEILKKFEEKS